MASVIVWQVRQETPSSSLVFPCFSKVFTNVWAFDSNKVFAKKLSSIAWLVLVSPVVKALGLWQPIHHFLNSTPSTSPAIDSITI